MNKICVYTCITGDYDNLNELKNKEKGRLSLFYK